MISVEPIREEKKIKALKSYLIGSKKLRNYALVSLGLNSALRISDILQFKWGMVYDFEENQFKRDVYITEQKTGKYKKFILNNSALESLSTYLESISMPEPDTYIFKSREGKNSPISRQMAYKIIKDASNDIGIKENVACHSLRKTFGYCSAKKGVPIHVLMELFNHSSERITMRYLGITQDDLDDVYSLVEL